MLLKFEPRSRVRILSLFLLQSTLTSPLPHVCSQGRTKDAWFKERSENKFDLIWSDLKYDNQCFQHIKKLKTMKFNVLLSTGYRLYFVWVVWVPCFLIKWSIFSGEELVLFSSRGGKLSLSVRLAEAGGNRELNELREGSCTNFPAPKFLRRSWY